MGFLRIVLILVCFLLPCQASDPWTKSEVALEATYQVLLFIDWKQTSEFHRHKTYTNYPTVDGPNYYITPMKEANPFMPIFPKQRTINAMCLLSSIGHVLVSHNLSHNNRLFWQGTTLIVEAYYVNSNYNLKVVIRW